MEVLYLGDCPGLAIEESIQHQLGLPALLAYLRGEAVEGVEELDLYYCYLTALPEGIGRLVGLKKLGLRLNDGLITLPAGLWTLVGLEELNLFQCGLRALPEGIGRLVGLKRLDLSNNKDLTALPAGLGQLRNLEELELYLCPGLAALQDLRWREGLPLLLAYLAAQVVPAVVGGQL